VRIKGPLTGTLAACLFVLLLPFPIASVVSADVSPFDSEPVHEAGHIEDVFTDQSANDIPLTVFYPAMSEGEDTVADTSRAPYPTVCFVGQEGAYPSEDYYASYGVHLSRRGFVVLMANLSVHEGVADGYAMMANSTLGALDHAMAENVRTGSRLLGMVNSSAMAVAGHGPGAKVALLASLADGGDLVKAVSCLGLLDTPLGDPLAAHRTGRIDMPLQVLGGAWDTIADRSDWTTAFGSKATGYASRMVMSNATNVHFKDTLLPEDVSSGEPELEVEDWSDQLNNTHMYLSAFLDRHLRNDLAAGDRLYGSRAQADLDDGTLLAWQYGVLDQSVDEARPGPGTTIPTGFHAFCATVSNVGPFPMTARNVTLEVARVVAGQRAFVSVYGPVNRTAAAMPPGGRETLGWTVQLTQYGEHVAFFKMDDPDHNRTNNRVQVPFNVSPLAPPEITHTPPDEVELGEPIYVSCTIFSPSGVSRAKVNYTDELGYATAHDLVEGAVPGTWSVSLPAPTSLGEVSYRIEVRASNGATNSTWRFYLPVVDTTPPVISWIDSGIRQIPVNMEADWIVSVYDKGELDEVKLVYTDPSTGFHNVSCGRKDGTWFYPMVTGMEEGPFEFSFYARDTWGNVAILGPYTKYLVDLYPPSIDVGPADPVTVGEVPQLSAVVTDNAQVTSVWVHYLLPGWQVAVNGTPTRLGDEFKIALPVPTGPGVITFSWGALDVNGKGNSTGDLELPVLDEEGPSIEEVTVGNSTVGVRPFVEAVVTDPGGVTSARVEYTDVDGVEGTADMDHTIGDVYMGELPVQTRGGILTYRVVAHDGSGNVASTSNRTTVIQDVNPPVIVHEPPDSLVEGSTVVIELTVTDDVGISSVFIYVKHSIQGSFARFEMESAGAGIFRHTILGANLSPPAIQYYFEAEDMPPSSNVALDPKGAPQFVYQGDVTHLELELHGVVRGRGDKPIKGAKVQVEGVDLEATSGADGSYGIAGLYVGTYTVTVSAGGYQDLTLDIVLTVEGGDREQDFVLVVVPGEPEDESSSMYLYLGSLLIIVAIVVLVLALRRRPGQRTGG
jgi:hypothetical protein